MLHDLLAIVQQEEKTVSKKEQLYIVMGHDNKDLERCLRAMMIGGKHFFYATKFNLQG